MKSINNKQSNKTQAWKLLDGEEDSKNIVNGKLFEEDGEAIEAIKMGGKVLRRVQIIFIKSIFDSIIPSGWNNVLIILLIKQFV